MRYPDNPNNISLGFLLSLDKDPPGTWLAQPKYGRAEAGWRRVIHVDGNAINVQSKHGNDRRQFPKEMRAQIECLLGGLDGVTLDCEWCGKRHEEKDQLFVFDILRNGGKWLTHMPTSERFSLMRSMRLLNVPVFPNPGLEDRFVEQLQNPYSEGLVVRKADSLLILSEGRCAENPMWFKVKLHTYNRVLQFQEDKGNGGDGTVF